MPKVHGKVTAVSLGGADLSTYSNSVEFKRSSDSHDVTTFGNDAHVYQGGLLDGTATIQGFYDSTATVGPRAVIVPKIGTNVTLLHRPEGVGAGRAQDSVDVLVTNYTETSPVADMVTFTVELQLSGVVTTAAQ